MLPHSTFNLDQISALRFVVGEGKTFSEVVWADCYFSLRAATTQWGVGPHCRKNYISIERMSCCAGVIAPQSHNLWPLTPAEICILLEHRSSVLRLSQILQDSQPRLWMQKNVFRAKEKMATIWPECQYQYLLRTGCARGRHREKCAAWQVGFISDITKTLLIPVVSVHPVTLYIKGLVISIS